MTLQKQIELNNLCELNRELLVQIGIHYAYLMQPNVDNHDTIVRNIAVGEKLGELSIKLSQVNLDIYEIISEDALKGY